MVPPHQHRRNASEMAIGTFKNHLLSGLATCDEDYQIHEWDRILPQCELTLNLLRNSQINTKISSWVIIHGHHNFNKVPFLAPLGTEILVHNKPQQQHSWQNHGTNGWYIGPAFEHYRCLHCYLPITRTEVINDTVKLTPKHIPIPESDLETYVRASIQELIYLLKHKKILPG